MAITTYSLSPWVFSTRLHHDVDNLSHLGSLHTRSLATCDMSSLHAYSYLWVLHDWMGVAQAVILSNPLLFMWAVRALLRWLLLLQLASQNVLILCPGTLGLLHIGRFQIVEELRGLCPYRLNYQPNLHIWSWGADGGADGHILLSFETLESCTPGLSHFLLLSHWVMY